MPFLDFEILQCLPNRLVRVRVEDQVFDDGLQDLLDTAPLQPLEDALVWVALLRGGVPGRWARVMPRRFVQVVPQAHILEGGIEFKFDRL